MTVGIITVRIITGRIILVHSEVRSDAMGDDKDQPGFQLVGEPKAPEPEGIRAPRSVDTPMTFAAFVLSLASSALVHLGQAPDAAMRALGLEQADLDLALGSETIAILEMLREKTRGNLDADERRLLDEALHDLRMHLVAARRRA